MSGPRASATVVPHGAKKSYFFSFPFLTLIIAEKVRKWEATGDPKILTNPPESSKILSTVPFGQVLYAGSEKTTHIADFRVS